MTGIDVDELIGNMLGSIKVAVGDDLDDIIDEIRDDLELFAMSAARIAAKKVSGEINEDEAKFLMRLRRNALEAELLRYKIKAKVTLEKAINAVISTVVEAFKSASGVAIPI